MARDRRNQKPLFSNLSGRTIRLLMIGAVALAVVAIVLVTLALAGVFEKPRSYSGPERVLADGNGQGIDLLKEPADDAKVIVELKTGTVLLVEEEQGDWLHVTVRRTGESGWCKESDVKREDR